MPRGPVQDDLRRDFLKAPFLQGASAVDRLEILHCAGDQLALAADYGLRQMHVGHKALQRAIAIAHEPSLEHIARGRAHEPDVADNVFTNLSELAGYMINRDLLHEKWHVGVASELAIIGLAWWGISSGREPGNSYIVPSTNEEDRGVREGRPNGVDFAYHRRKKVIPVQVKTVLKDRDNVYDPRIKLVSPDCLSPSETRFRETSKLLEMIAAKDEVGLIPRHVKFIAKLKETRV